MKAPSPKVLAILDGNRFDQIKRLANYSANLARSGASSAARGDARGARTSLGMAAIALTEALKMFDALGYSAEGDER
jgi:hypothetical protein